MRIGMLTSGGDCQCLNATMEAIAKVLYKKNKDIEIYGILDGFAGLINGKYKKMEKADFDNILLSGGTILGTSRQPFKTITKPDENGGRGSRPPGTARSAAPPSCIWGPDRG